MATWSSTYNELRLDDDSLTSAPPPWQHDAAELLPNGLSYQSHFATNLQTDTLRRGAQQGHPIFHFPVNTPTLSLPPFPPPFPISRPQPSPAVAGAALQGGGGGGGASGTGASFVAVSAFPNSYAAGPGLSSPSLPLECGGFGFSTSFTSAAGRNTLRRPSLRTASTPAGSDPTLILPTVLSPNRPDPNINNFTSTRIHHSTRDQSRSLTGLFISNPDGSPTFYHQPSHPFSPVHIHLNADQHFSTVAPIDSTSPFSASPQQPEHNATPSTTPITTSSHYHQLPPPVSTPFPPALPTPHLKTTPSGPLGNLTEVVVDDHDSNEITVDSLLSEMPAAASRKRTRAASSFDEPAGPSGKRRPSASGRPTSSRGRKPGRDITVVEVPDSDDIFAVDDFEEGEHKLFDLTKDNNLPEALLTPKEDTSIRLAKFECIICMDNASNLTVTHCGHMFCAQCLHQAMHTEVTKKICPMCRQKLDLRPKNGTLNKNAKSFFPLELKLMPSKRQGKQPARR